MQCNLELQPTTEACAVDCVLDTTWTTAETCDPATGLQIETRGEAISAKNGGSVCQDSDKNRTSPGVCDSGSTCGVISSGVFGCKLLGAKSVDGSITRTTTSVSIDYVDFELETASVVELDILSMEVISNYNGTTGTTHVDVNGDCNAGYIDSSIVLISVNADGSNNQVVASNDNAAAGQGLNDGSLSTADSFLSVSLQSSRYRVAVGVSMSTAQALAKTMPLANAPRECDTSNARYGSYRLTVNATSSDVTVTSPGTYVGSQCSSLNMYSPYTACPYHKEQPVNTSAEAGVVEGMIRRVSGGVSVDYIRFTMPELGRVLIDVNSYEKNRRLGGYTNVNGYCGSAYIDAYAFLFRATPNATTIVAGLHLVFRSDQPFWRPLLSEATPRWHIYRP